MDFEVCLTEEREESAAGFNPEREVALQNLTDMDLKIALLKQHYSNTLRLSHYKAVPEDGVFSQTFKVYSHKFELASNDLIFGQTVEFLNDPEPSTFMFTNETEEQDPSLSILAKSYISQLTDKVLIQESSSDLTPSHIPSVPSQALTERRELAECEACPQLKSTVTALELKVRQLEAKNGQLQSFCKKLQDELSHANATVTYLRKRQDESLSLSRTKDSADDWIGRFTALLGSTNTSRVSPHCSCLDPSLSQSPKKQTATIGVQCVGSQPRTDLESMLENPGIPKVKVSSQSPLKSPGSIRRGSYWGMYGKSVRKPEDESQMLRPQILENWVKGLRSGSMSPLSRSRTEHTKKKTPLEQPQISPVEAVLRRKIVGMMKEKDVVRMIQLKQSNP